MNSKQYVIGSVACQFLKPTVFLVIKMDSLKLSQSALKFLGVCAVKESAPLWIKARNQLFYALMVLMHIINSILSGLYFIMYVTVDYDGGLYALLSATVLICNLHTLGTLRYNSDKMRMIFLTLKSIYRESKNEEFLNEMIIKNKNQVNIQLFILDENSDAFQSSSYAQRIGSKIALVFIKIYGPLYPTVLTSIPIIELTQCYFQDHLTNPKCLHIPYRYV